MLGLDAAELLDVERAPCREALVGANGPPAPGSPARSWRGSRLHDIRRRLDDIGRGLHHDGRRRDDHRLRHDHRRRPVAARDHAGDVGVVVHELQTLHEVAGTRGPGADRGSADWTRRGADAGTMTATDRPALLADGVSPLTT